jgi:hypothetical protein
MAGELRGVEVRLERAHEHIDALNHEARMFMMELPSPYGHAIPEKAVDGIYSVCARIFRPPPVRLGVLAADAAHNLRAALDMIAWELAFKGPNPPSEDDRQTGFPICTSLESWEAPSSRRMIERLPDDATEIIRAFQPFNHGQPPYLVLVQAIDNWAKHHAIPTLMTFHISGIRVLSGQEVISVNRGAFEDGDEVCRIRASDVLGPDGKEHFTAYLRCHVGFSKAGPAKGFPVEFLLNAHDFLRDGLLPAFQRFFPD